MCFPILELMYVIFSDSFHTWVGLGKAMESNLFFNLMIFYELLLTDGGWFSFTDLLMLHLVMMVLRNSADMDGLCPVLDLDY